MRRGRPSTRQFHEVKIDFTTTATNSAATSNTQLFFCPLCARRTKPSPFTYRDLVRHTYRYHGMQRGGTALFDDNPQIPKRIDPTTGQLQAVRCVYEECSEWLEPDVNTYRTHVLDHSAEFLAALEEVGFSPPRGIQEWYRGFPCASARCQKMYYTEHAARQCCQPPSPAITMDMLTGVVLFENLNTTILDSCGSPPIPTIPLLTIRILSEEHKRAEEAAVQPTKKRRKNAAPNFTLVEDPL